MKILGFPWTIRTRLSLLYAGAFFIACVALIVVIYLYLGQVLDRQFIVRLRDLGPPGGGLPSPEIMEETGRLNVMVRQARSNTLDNMLMVSLALVGVMTLVAGLIGWLVAGHALRPLRDITTTARRVADRSLHERIALAGPKDEIRDLADTLDAMLERLDRSFDSQRRFVANASHELRTPLTITRTLIEVAMLDGRASADTRQLAGTLLAVNQRHERLIEGLLTLAGSEQPAIDRQPVDLAEIAEHVVGDLQPVAAKAGVELRAELQPTAIGGDPLLLERLIRNLMENAIRYNLPSGGWARIATGNGQLIVENTGPTVPSHEIPGLFEPFRRMTGNERIADIGKSDLPRGAGLGLSIVRSVALAHDGTVEASARADGGLVVRVQFPMLADD